MPGILQKAAGGDADAVVSSSSAELMETVSSVTEAVLLWLLLSVDCVQLEDCDRISAGIGDDDDSDDFTGVLTVSLSSCASSSSLANHCKKNLLKTVDTCTPCCAA